MLDIDYGKIIAKNLKRIAYEHDRTQADIARDLNISKTTVSSWMNGTRIPRMKKIDLLCQYFNVKRSDIMEPHDDQEPHRFHFDDESAAIAQEVFENRDLRFLMKSARGCKPEHIRNAAELLQALKETNPDG